MELKKTLSKHQASDIERKLPANLAILAEKYGVASYTEFALIVPIFTDGEKFGFDALVKNPELEFNSVEDAIAAHVELYKEHLDEQL